MSNLALTGGMRYNIRTTIDKTPAQNANSVRGMGKPLGRSTMRKNISNPNQLPLFDLVTLKPVEVDKPLQQRPIVFPSFSDRDFVDAWQQACGAKTEQCTDAAIARREFIKQCAKRVSSPPELLEAKKMLYFMKCGDAVKVGVSIDPESRVRQVRTGNQGIVTLLASFPNLGKFEKACHTRLADNHISGEWFIYDYDVEVLLQELRVIDAGNVDDLVAGFRS